MSWYKEVVLASLLHDIGKFYQKAADVGIDNSGKHPEISRRFIRKHASLFERYADVSVLEELVCRHHDNAAAFPEICLADHASENIRPYAHMISLSDNLSSCERDEKSETYKDYRKRPLNSVFSRLFNADSEDQYAYPAKVRSVNNIFPQKTDRNSEFDCHELIELFNEEIKKLEKNSPDDFYQFVVMLDTILQQFLWVIPASSVDRVADVSLYDHLKTTSAIASALYQYHESIGKTGKSDIRKNGEKFLLLEGTFSGIQKYIFSAASTNASGVAKRLRARSFYVDALIGAIAQSFIDEFYLTRENILMLTGGKFCLLLPNYPGAEQKIEKLTARIEQELFFRFYSDIKVCIAYKPMDYDGFSRYSDIVSELSALLSERKNQPFRSILKNDEVWDESSFFLYEDLTDKKICNVCGKRLISHERNECEDCESHTLLGEKLVKSRYISYRRSETVPERQSWHLIGNYYLEMSEEVTDPEGLYLVQQLNNELICEDNFSFPMEIKYLANNRAKNQDEILSFNDIANNSRGRKALGVLKADVDVLGFLFAEGLKKDDRHYGTISRIGTMSRMLDMFFSGYVNALLKSKFPLAYSVFSGGDDLFLIAPWSDIVKISLILQRKFTEATAANPAVTMSAALCIFPSKMHIALMAEESEKVLKSVKNQGNPILYPEHKGRNSVYFMGDILKWEDLFLVHSLAEKTMCPAQEITGIRVLQRVMKYSSSYRDFLTDKDIMKLMFEPLLTYDMKRNYKQDWASDERSKNFWKYINGISADAANSANYKKGVMKNLYLAKTAVKYSMDLTKEDRNG